MKNTSDSIIINSYKVFIDRYQDFIPKEIFRNILKSFSLDLKNHNLYYMQELYSYLNMFGDKDPYDYIVSLMKYVYGFENDVLNIETGLISILSKKIDSEQSNYGRGNITSYNPSSIMSYYGTLPIIKDANKINYDEYNILISSISNNYKELVDIAIKHNQDFLFLLNPYRLDGLHGFTQHYADKELITYCNQNIPKTKVLCQNRLSTGKRRDALLIYTTNKN